MTLLKYATAIAVTVLPAACAWGPPAGNQAPAAAAAAPVPRPSPSPLAPGWVIDPARSQLRVLVFRGGAMAALGHNHVITDSVLRGALRPAVGGADATLRLELAPADFVIDAPDARAAAGAAFADPVSAEARSGTRDHLFGPSQLDVAQYPLIVVDGSAAASQGGAATASLRVAVAGHESPLSVGFTWQARGSDIEIDADFPLSQASLGLTPYSVLMGALRVDDGLRVQLHLVATPAAPR